MVQVQVLFPFSHLLYYDQVIPKILKMEPTAVVLGAQHKQWSRENKPVSHNWKKAVAGSTWTNRSETDWAVNFHLT